MSRSKEVRNDMEEEREAKKVRRMFTPEQKSEILKDIEGRKTIEDGLEKHSKEPGQVEPYERRAAPWKSSRCAVWQRSLTNFDGRP